jgi:hypothetical protein
MTPRNTPLLRLVGVILLTAAGLVTWVGVETVRASGDTSVREGLDYRAFLGAVDDLVEGAGDSTLLEIRTVEEKVGRRVLRYDSLEITADLYAFPAFQEGGFLFDQVQAYNRFQRERL